MILSSSRTAWSLNGVLLLNLGVTYWLFLQPGDGSFLDGLGYLLYGVGSLFGSALLNAVCWLLAIRQGAPQAAVIYGIAALLHASAVTACFVISRKLGWV